MQTFEYKPFVPKLDPVQEQIDQKFEDFDPDSEDDQIGKIDQKIIQNYIDKQMAIKLQELKEDLDA